MPQYEMVYIVRPDLEPDGVQAVVDRIGQRVHEQGGSVDFVEVWGKRRMAFPLRKSREGIYVLTRFTLDSARVPELKRLTRIMDEVVRSLIVVAEGPTPSAKVSVERPVEAAKEASESATPEQAGEDAGTEAE
jgi:small subunit ribosomal protein S6